MLKQLIQILNIMHKNTIIFSLHEKDVYIQTLEVLNRSGVIIYPTETLYGIGAYATDLNAINEIYAIKDFVRPKSFSL